MVTNIYSTFGLVARLVTLGLLIAYVIPKQITEVRRPKNEFTGLRWLILIGIVAYCFTSIPSILFNITRLSQPQVLNLQNVATVSGNLANLVVGIVLYLIYNYKDKTGG